MPQRRRAHERGLLLRPQPEFYSLVVVYGSSWHGRTSICTHLKRTPWAKGWQLARLQYVVKKRQDTLLTGERTRELLGSIAIARKTPRD
jgi:hypothetical protein